MSATLAADVDELQLAIVQLKLQGVACRLITRAEFAADWKWRFDRVVLYAVRNPETPQLYATIEIGWIGPDGYRGQFANNVADDDPLIAACWSLLGMEATWFSSGGGI